jgi:hypothetical protein
MDQDYAATNAAERAAFANGQQSRQAEIDSLLAALQAVRAILNSNDRYKARSARLYLQKVLHDVTPPDCGMS